jgi:hypothetical protein
VIAGNSANVVFSDLDILILLALARWVLHSLIDGQHGWHHDELATLDDARYPAWGYVAYPSVTPSAHGSRSDSEAPALVPRSQRPIDRSEPSWASRFWKLGISSKLFFDKRRG